MGNTFRIAHALGSIQNHEMSSSRRIRRRDVVVGTDRQLYLPLLYTGEALSIGCIVGASGERMRRVGP
ncbi:MAG: hypothetical protein ACJ788_18590, partial [Ktedonobacteraceae bacterium]